MSPVSIKKSPLFHSIAYLVLTAFISMLPANPSYAQVVMLMPAPGQMLHVTQHFEPPQMVGLKVNLKDPFSFNFIMDQGQDFMSDDVKRQEFNKIIKYFLVSLAMPNKDMWVNLSPYEKGRIIPAVFAQTEMGCDLLAQDYVLKQFTSSLIYPEEGLGKKFWAKIYKEAQERFGTTNINVNTFNKVWIMADKADIYQKGDVAFLVSSHLKVMLEQDYMAMEKNKDIFGTTQAAADINKDVKTKMASNIVREIIIPAIEKEVNEGKSFAAVRQAYSAEIMATWFKRVLRESLLGQVFADKGKIAGQIVDDPRANEKIYRQYLRAYKKGVFNYIKEDLTPDGQTIPRKYFSGGMDPVDWAMINTLTSVDLAKRADKKREVVGFAQRIVSGTTAWSMVLVTFGIQLADAINHLTNHPVLLALASVAATGAAGAMAQRFEARRGAKIQQAIGLGTTSIKGAKSQQEAQPSTAAESKSAKIDQEIKDSWSNIEQAAGNIERIDRELTVIQGGKKERTARITGSIEKFRALRSQAESLYEKVSTADLKARGVIRYKMNVILNTIRVYETELIQEGQKVGVTRQVQEEQPPRIPKEKPPVAAVGTAAKPETTRIRPLSDKEVPIVVSLKSAILERQRLNNLYQRILEFMKDSHQQDLQDVRNQLQQLIQIGEELGNTYIITSDLERSVSVIPTILRYNMDNMSAILTKSREVLLNAFGDILRAEDFSPTLDIHVMTRILNAIIEYYGMKNNLQERIRGLERPANTLHTVQEKIAGLEKELEALKKQTGIFNRNERYINLKSRDIKAWEKRKNELLDDTKVNEQELRALKLQLDVLEHGGIRYILNNESAEKNRRQNGKSSAPELAVPARVAPVSSVGAQQTDFDVELGRRLAALEREAQDLTAFDAKVHATAQSKAEEAIESMINDEIKYMIIEEVTRPSAPIMAASLQPWREAQQRRNLKIIDLMLAEVIRSYEPVVLVSQAPSPGSFAALRGIAPARKLAANAAMKAVGGINLSDEHLILNIRVDGAGMPLPIRFQDKAMMNLNGLTSIIRKITPLTSENLPELYELVK